MQVIGEGNRHPELRGFNPAYKIGESVPPYPPIPLKPWQRVYAQPPPAYISADARLNVDILKPVGCLSAKAQ